ncbi:MAG TPA: kelch repeat-containing protein [Candidatus Deferrimicrobium sp.]|nr:kelch repeat-containing protein [Candidatus Deferrimicrobium sp.]
MKSKTKKILAIGLSGIIVVHVLIITILMVPPSTPPPGAGPTNVWTWVSGSYSVDNIGFYGTKGVAGPVNVPGARWESVSWADAGGNFWLFGGQGYDNFDEGFLNDLWMFNVATTMWTWVSGNYSRNNYGTYGTKGVADSANVPGARSASVSWTDRGGNLWLFGGYGYTNASSGQLNDLWRFNVSDATWTWVSGSYSVNNLGTYGTKGVADAANVPGARVYSISWTDTVGNLWLFGGYGRSNASLGVLNDLWMFNVSDATWTWVSGSYSVNNLGTYGTKGVADPANVPGARYDVESWTDAGGNFWLFGGEGYDNASSGFLNDLWRFNVSDVTWMWVSGNYSVNNYGMYGTKGVANPANVPGARNGGASWTDAGGNFWLFGGQGYDNASSGFLNDLWRFNVSDATWIWVSGDYFSGNDGTYDMNEMNMPGARDSPASWTDAGGNFWLFGGYGWSDGPEGYLNDLWKYTL